MIVSRNMCKSLSGVVLALLCVGSLSAAERRAFSAFQLKEHTETPSSKDHNKFMDWILGKKPSQGKKALLTATTGSSHYPFTPTITWYKAQLASSDFDALLTRTYSTPAVAVSTTSGYYDYTPSGAFWVDFANENTFGGGFRSNGNTQEERMFFEFPQLADLAYILRGGSKILPVSGGEAEPFLIVNAMRKYDVSNVPYGRALDSASPTEIQNDIVFLPKPYASANIIGLAAKDYRKKSGGKYSLNDLKYHLEAALLGDLGALQYNGKNSPVVHTGRWGAGVFKNSVSMMTALQILAAEMAFSGNTNSSQLVFHGIDSALVSSLEQEVVQSLQAGVTPLALLKTFRDRQTFDASWRPQT